MEQVAEKSRIGAHRPNRMIPFDPFTGADRKIINIHDERFFHWSLSHNGLLLAVVAQDNHERRIRLFSLADRTARDLLVRGWSGLNTVDWAADSKTLFPSAIKPDGTTFRLNTDLGGRARLLLEQKNSVICWAILRLTESTWRPCRWRGKAMLDC
jgi:hypothetical protein